MNNEIFLFYRNSIARNLCKEYSNEFRKYLEDKERLFNLCMRQQSIPYFATACYEQWGLDMRFIEREYRAYINGKYTAKNCDNVKGYTYELWCNYKKTINVNVDVIHLMQCDCSVCIPSTKCSTLYISNKSDVDIYCRGYNTIRIYLLDESIINLNECGKDCNITIYKYSDKCETNTDNNCNGSIKIINKKLKL